MNRPVGKCTRRELKAKLSQLAEAIEKEPLYSQTMGMHDGKGLALVWLGLAAGPHTVTIVAAIYGEARAMDMGVSTCSPEDEWSAAIGHKIAMDKALDNVVAKLLKGGYELRRVDEGETPKHACSRTFKVLLEEVLYARMQKEMACDTTD